MHRPIRALVLYVAPAAPAVIAVWAAHAHRPAVIVVALLLISLALGVSAFLRSKRIKRRASEPPAG